MKTLSVGQTVEAVVESILPFGVFAVLDDGQRAYIRRRELDLDADVDPHRVVKQGERIQSVVLRIDEWGKSIELSRRATLQDPWAEFVQQFGAGSVVRCTVRALHPHGVFVRIRAGIDGFVPLEELTARPVRKPEEVLWVGDETEATIMRIEHQRRHINLSIKARMKQYDRALDVSGKISNGIRDNVQLEDFKNLEMTVDTKLAEKAGPILIAEDDEYVRDSLSTWLRQKGFEVFVAETVPQAIEVQSRPCKVYFIDLDLWGNDGLDLIHHVKKINRESFICVMSSPEMLEGRAGEIEAVQISGVFAKPLDVSEIEKFLNKVARNELHSFWRVDQSTYEKRSVPVAFSNFEKPHSNRLSDVMEDIRALVKAENGILFQLEQDTQTISVVTHSGIDNLDSSASYGLKVSPVNDVIREGEPIIEKHVTEKALARFEKLLNLLHFESCIGVPVKVQGEIRHAAFFFHSQAEAFSNHRLRDAQSGALLLSEILTEEIVQERLVRLNPMLLSGELAASFGHDVFNKITALELEARNLTDSRLAGDSTRSQRVLELVLDLKNTVYAFQQMLRVKEKMEVVNINYMIERAALLLRDLTRKERVKVVKNLSPAALNVIGNPTFLQQAFLNIMLNAIQQMALKSERFGWNEQPVLEIGSTVSTSHNRLQIRFKDNGPGIHRVHHAKLFSPGFSTRDGSGLGLYIAHSFIQALGGTLQVEESFVPLGTTFLVEMPIATTEISR